MLARKTVFFAVFAFVFVAKFHLGQSLQCVVCTSLTDEDCASKPDNFKSDVCSVLTTPAPPVTDVPESTITTISTSESATSSPDVTTTEGTTLSSVETTTESATSSTDAITSADPTTSTDAITSASPTTSSDGLTSTSTSSSSDGSTNPRATTSSAGSTSVSTSSSSDGSTNPSATTSSAGSTSASTSSSSAGSTSASATPSSAGSTSASTSSSSAETSLEDSTLPSSISSTESSTSSSDQSTIPSSTDTSDTDTTSLPDITTTSDNLAEESTAFSDRRRMRFGYQVVSARAAESQSCYKIIYKKDDKEVVERGCAQPSEGCDQLKTGKDGVTYCDTCDMDGCNSSSMITYSLTPMLLLLGVTFYLTR